MAAITITAANVVKDANAEIEYGILGATITAGQVVYKNTSTGKFELADANSATAEVRGPRGVALNGGALNQPVAVQYGGDITIGGTAVVGTTYALGSTAGAIVPVADLTTGDYVSHIGVGISATKIRLNIKNFGIAVP